MSDDEKDLGDPMQPRPGDPQHVVLRVNAQQLQAIVAGLGELPGKLSRAPLNEIERQVRETVLAVRRANRDAERKSGDERKAAAEERRKRREARHARVNGTPEAPPAQ